MHPWQRTFAKLERSETWPAKVLGSGDTWMPGSLGAGTRQDLQAPLHDEVRKPRDLFPVPLLRDDLGDTEGLSRSCQRRVLRRGHLLAEANRTITAGKILSAGDTFVGASEAVQAFVFYAILEMGRPPALTCTGALKQLRVADGYAVDQSVGALASYDPDRVSLPEPGWRPIPLYELWGSSGRERVDEFVRDQLLPPEVATVHVAECGVKRPYFDPLLRQPKNYSQFLRRLAAFNLIDFSLEAPREEIAHLLCA